MIHVFTPKFLIKNPSNLSLVDFLFSFETTHLINLIRIFDDTQSCLMFNFDASLLISFLINKTFQFGLKQIWVNITKA
jgi:hypothetical protein